MQAPSDIQSVPIQAGRPRYTAAQLDQIVSAHERFHRGQPRARRAILRFLQGQGVDLSRRILVESDFTGAELRDACLFMADFERASLFCADLRGTDARGINLFRADLRGCSLREANLAGARLDDADLRDAILARYDAANGFNYVNRPGGTLDGGGIRFSVDFTNCSMKRVRMGKAKLKNANFTGAMLQGADLKGAILNGAKFDGAVLIGADLAHASIDAGALDKCVLAPSSEAVQRAVELSERLVVAARWIATNGAEGRPAMLDGEDLRPLGEAFVGSRLTALSAKGACALGVSFMGAQLQGANFENADLREADFTGADLRGCCLRGANLSHAKFDKADLRPLVLNSGQRAVDLTDAQYAEDAFASCRR